MDRDVVVTGAAAVTPLGDSVDAALAALLDGRRLSREQAHAAAAPLSFEGLPIRRRDANRLTRADALAVVAAGRATVASGFADDEAAAADAALYLGTSKDLGSYQDFIDLIPEIGADAVQADVLAAIVDRAAGMMSPFFLLDCMPNLAMHYIATMFGIRGDNCCFTALGCAGAEAVAQVARAVAGGGVEVGLAGGFDRLIDPLNHSRLVAQWFLAEDPPEAGDGYHPHDRAPGFPVFADGAGALVLEERERAEQRGAAVRGRMLGVGAASGTHPPYGVCGPDGVAHAVGRALADAGIQPSELAFVVASGQGEPTVDAAEARGLSEALAGADVPVTAWKGGLGHLLGAAAPVELILALECLERGVVAPAVGCVEPPEFDGSPSFVLGDPVTVTGTAALVVSLGVRGQAHAFVLGRKDS